MGLGTFVGRGRMRCLPAAVFMAAAALLHSADAAVFQASGHLTRTIYDQEKIFSTVQRTFKVAVSNEVWSIRVDFPAGEQGIEYEDAYFDGADLFSLSKSDVRPEQTSP